jgi:hypothetical protein
MDCLRSFNFNAKVSAFNFGTPGSSVKTWLNGVQEFFVFSSGGNSVFDIQGFKNINIYSCKVVGNVQSPLTGTGGVVLEDWSFEVFLNGQAPLISGTPSLISNTWNLTTNSDDSRTFDIGKHCPKVDFSTPYQSVTTIEIRKIKGQGYGAQTPGLVVLDIDVNFIFEYRYEGE